VYTYAGRHTKGTGNRNAIAISENFDQPKLNTRYWMVQRNSLKDWETQLPGNGVPQSSHNCLGAWFRSVSCYLRRVDAWCKMHENLTKLLILFFVQLIEKEPRMYDKRDPNCARQDKVVIDGDRIQVKYFRNNRSASV
jgi:hypothetical protein